MSHIYLFVYFIVAEFLKLQTYFLCTLLRDFVCIFCDNEAAFRNDDVTLTDVTIHITEKRHSRKVDKRGEYDTPPPKPAGKEAGAKVEADARAGEAEAKAEAEAGAEAGT